MGKIGRRITILGLLLLFLAMGFGLVWVCHGILEKVNHLEQTAKTIKQRYVCGQIMILDNERVPDQAIRSCLAIFPGKEITIGDWLVSYQNLDRLYGGSKLWYGQPPPGIYIVPPQRNFEEGEKVFVDIVVQVPPF